MEATTNKKKMIARRITCLNVSGLSALRTVFKPQQLSINRLTYPILRSISNVTINAKKKDIELSGRQLVKPLNSRKTYLIDFYKHMMETSPLVVFVHYNNLIKTEDHYYRDQIKKAGGKLTKLRNALFQVYLRNSKMDDPCAPITDESILVKDHPLLPLFTGPTAAITFPDVDPEKLSKLLKVLDASKERLFIIGAKVDSSVLDVNKVHQFSKLPPLPVLQAQIVCLLQSAAGLNLVQTLESASQSLCLTLKSHEDNIKGTA